MLVNLANGHRLLVAGQKSGIVWGHDPDRSGCSLVWHAQLVDKLAPEHDHTSGGAADEKMVYFGPRTGGIAAVDSATGEKSGRRRFRQSDRTTARRNGCDHRDSGRDLLWRLGRHTSRFSQQTTAICFKYNVLHEYDTVNHVPVKGGAPDGRARSDCS